jgi:hypothetical protein
MSLTRPYILTYLTGIIMLGLPVIASAQQEGPFTTSTPITNQVTDFNLPLAFQKFDTFGGTRTLTSILFEMTSVSITTQITVTNSAASSSNGIVHTNSVYTFTDPGSFFNYQTNLNTPNQAYALTPGQQTTLAQQTASNGTTTKTINSSDPNWTAIKAEVTGAGTFNIAASTFTQTIISNSGGNTTAGQTTTGSATGQVTYFYSLVGATPEPGSVGLGIGMGAFALAAAYRRRKTRK